MNTKTLTIVGAAVGASLMLANAANAFSVTTTKTVSDGFGDRVTKSRTFSNNGFRRCRSVTQSASDGFGDRRSRTIT